MDEVRDPAIEAANWYRRRDLRSLKKSVQLSSTLSSPVVDEGGRDDGDATVLSVRLVIGNGVAPRRGTAVVGRRSLVLLQP